MESSLTLWTGNRPATVPDGIGCASYGFATHTEWACPSDGLVVTSTLSPEGFRLSGTFASVLEDSQRYVGRKISAAVLLSASSVGMEAFLNAFSEKFPGVPCVGGIAAQHVSSDVVDIGLDKVQLLLITSGRVEVDTLNTHDSTGRMVEVEVIPESLRTIRRIRDIGGTWQNAPGFIRDIAEKEGVAEGMYERVTLSDLAGVNLHFREDNGVIIAGADVPISGRMVIRTTTCARTYAQLSDFASVRDAWVFGCAGLRSLCTIPFSVGTGTVMAFMFGEVVTLGGKPSYGNLMASRIVFKT